MFCKGDKTKILSLLLSLVMVLALVFIAGCEQAVQEPSQPETALQSSSKEPSALPDTTAVTDNQSQSQAPVAEPKPESSSSEPTTDNSKHSLETPPEMTPETSQETPPDTTPETSDTSVVGAWMLGMVSAGELNADTGKYENASGMGQIYTFKPDGSYTALVIFGDTIWLMGNYSVAGDVLTLTDRTAEESKDGGKTWSAPESLPDASSHFVSGADETGTYLLLGEEGAAPPLVDKENSLKYQRID